MFPSRSGVTLKQPGGWAVLNLKGDSFFLLFYFTFLVFSHVAEVLGRS